MSVVDQVVGRVANELGSREASQVDGARVGKNYSTSAVQSENTFGGRAQDRLAPLDGGLEPVSHPIEGGGGLTDLVTALQADPPVEGASGDLAGGGGQTSHRIGHLARQQQRQQDAERDGQHGSGHQRLLKLSARNGSLLPASGQERLLSLESLGEDSAHGIGLAFALDGADVFGDGLEVSDPGRGRTPQGDARLGNNIPPGLGPAGKLAPAGDLVGIVGSLNDERRQLSRERLLATDVGLEELLEPGDQETSEARLLIDQADQGDVGTADHAETVGDLIRGGLVS